MLLRPQLRQFSTIFAKTVSGQVLTKYSLDIDDTCVSRIKRLQKSDPIKYHSLRILVEGGGCAGFQYTFNMEAKKELSAEFIVFERDGVTVVSDEMTLDMINGSKIMYKEEMIRSAFEVVDNPMAEGGCSCGTSFTPKG